jgi:XTP/dITP diphosphohydrolase
MVRVFKELDKREKNWKNKKVKARFICALTIYGPNQKTIKSIGKVEGYIANSMKGKNGFGYDPIFIPKGKKITFGEMKPFEKYKIDHRFKAFKNIKKFL